MRSLLVLYFFIALALGWILGVSDGRETTERQCIGLSNKAYADANNVSRLENLIKLRNEAHLYCSDRLWRCQMELENE